MVNFAFLINIQTDYAITSVTDKIQQANDEGDFLSGIFGC